MADRDAMILCYVKDAWAWFTSVPLQQQWGDDWDDAPYEHNAGKPYTDHWLFGDRVPHDVFRCAWYGNAETPESLGRGNSPWSVRDINRGVVAWLTFEQDVIPAGTTFRDFCEIMRRNGGTVYVPAWEEVVDG